MPHWTVAARCTGAGAAQLIAGAGAMYTTSGAGSAHTTGAEEMYSGQALARRGLPLAVGARTQQDVRNAASIHIQSVTVSWVLVLHDLPALRAAQVLQGQSAVHAGHQGSGTAAVYAPSMGSLV